MKKFVALIAGLFLLLLGSHARADVFNMGPGLTSLQTVYVGDAGNAPDPTTGEGEVDYNYNIGTYDVTAEQYVEFLNAVGQQSAVYGLWNDSMPTDCGVVSVGIGGPYGVEPGWENRPVTDVDLWSAYRFVNWLDNGQGDGDTETGSYTLNGFTGNGYIQRNPGAQWYIPSLDEWYKAAFYKGRGINAGYWLYPTQSDTVPGNQLPDPGNSANCYNNGYTVGSPYYTTPVGAFSNSPGPYGTFDQGGNVYQWTDTMSGSAGSPEAHYNMEGGSWIDPPAYIGSNLATSRQKPYFYYSQLGFRVAEAVPEPPSALALLSMLGIPAALLCLRYRLREGCPREQPKHNSAAMLVVALLCCTALFAPTASHAAPDFSISITNSATLTHWLPMYEFYQINFQLNGLTYDIYNTGSTGVNPFRTVEEPEAFQAYQPYDFLWSTGPGVDVWAEFTDSAETVTRVNAFWDVPCNYLGYLSGNNITGNHMFKYVPSGDPYWAVRFMPQAVGGYTVNIKASDASGLVTCAAPKLNCVYPINRGPVCVSSNGTGFVYAGGEPYTAFSCKATDTDNMAVSGCNTTRQWISNAWNDGIYYQSDAPEAWILNASGGASYTTSQAHSGSQCVAMTASVQGTFLSQIRIAVNPNSYYTACGWFKRSGTSNAAGAICVTLLDTAGNPSTVTGNPVGSATWVPSSFTFATPASTDCLDFNLCVTQTDGGSIYVDDLGLFETTDITGSANRVNYNYLSNPSLEMETPARLRLPAMWMLDESFKESQAMGVTQELALFDYRVWGDSNGINPSDGFYPYYFSGALTDNETDDFWDFGGQTCAVDQEGMAMRYVSARFGAFRSLFSYELTNEMNPFYGWGGECVNWTSCMASTVSKLDPYGHMITNSFSGSPPGVGFSQVPAENYNAEHYYLEDEMLHPTNIPIGDTVLEQKTGCFLDSTGLNAHSGTCSAMLVGSSGTPDPNTGILWASALPMAYIKPNTQYNFTGYVKASAGSALLCTVWQVDADGNWFNSINLPTMTGASYGSIGTSVTTAANTAALTVHFQTTGNAWVDDLQLIDGGNRNLLYNGGFEAPRLGDDEYLWALFHATQTKHAVAAGPSAPSMAPPWTNEEFGLAGPGSDGSAYINPVSNSPHDSTGIHLHNGTWAAFMANGATMTPGYWWQDYLSYQWPGLGNYGLWPTYQGIVNFRQNLPFFERHDLVATDSSADVVATTGNALVRVIGQKWGENAYVWVQNSQNNWSNVVRNSGGAPSNLGQVSVTVPGFNQLGNHLVTLYETTYGNTMGSSLVHVGVDGNANFTVTLNATQADVAAVITFDCTVTGTVNLQSYNGDYNSTGQPIVPIKGMPVYIEVQSTDGTQCLECHNLVLLDSAGTYSFKTNLIGNYVVAAKCAHWEAKGHQVGLSPNTTVNVGFSLPNGDVNGDNFVEDQDYSLLGVSWYSGYGDPNYNVQADLNGDGFVEDQDYSIMGTNWYTGGDTWFPVTGPGGQMMMTQMQCGQAARPYHPIPPCPLPNHLGSASVP